MTWLADANGEAAADALTLKPGIYELWTRTLTASEEMIDPSLREFCRSQIAGSYGRNKGEAIAPATDLQRDLLEFLEQMILYPTGVDEDLRERLSAQLSSQELMRLTFAAHALDSDLRARVLLEIDSEAPAAGPRDENLDREPAFGLPNIDLEFDDSLRRFALAARPGSLVDETTIELCRLRNALHQDCKLCMSVRRAVEKPADTPDLMEHVRNYEHSPLSEAQKSALAFTDAYLVAPTAFGDDRRSELLEHFSPDQVVELVFLLIYSTFNKPMIALGLDGAADSQRLSVFHFDGTGNAVFHQPTPS